MSSNLKVRLAVLGILLLGIIWALFPREVEITRRVGDEATVTRERQWPLRLGLDLVGGMHIALEIDESEGAVADREDAIERALAVVRNRIDEFGVSEPVVQKVGEDRIIVELPGIDDQERALQIVERSAFLEFRITDETQALDRVMARLDAVVRERGLEREVAAAPGQPAQRTGRALDQLFTPDVDTALDTTAVDTAALTAPTEGPFSRRVLRLPDGMPGEYHVAAADTLAVRRFLADEAVRAALPPGKVLRWGNESLQIGNDVYRPLYVLDARPIITGEYLTDARPVQDPIEGTLVSFQLNNEGGRRFGMETGRHLGDYMAIVLDDRVIGRPPVIQGQIRTRGQITMGRRDLQAAQDLALVLRAGALPVPLTVAEIRQVGATLGEDSIQAGQTASAVAVLLVVIFMLIYYRFSGFLAVVALMVYVALTLAILAGFGGALTLPGIAGFVLSIGMAVDANVLIFERIREELDAGKTVRTSIDEGFRNALSAIVDANVTTALTAMVLYQYGTGPVRGFAVTLLAGIVASMVTSLFVVRTFYLLWLTRARRAEALSI